MINFFRKIRKQLFIANKLTRYVIYAFGEIVLIVFGILIAIQVSNWNESKKSDERIETLLNAVENDLIKNIEHANRIYRSLYISHVRAHDIMDDLLTRDDYRKSEILRIHTMSYAEFLPLSDNLNQLILKEESVPIIYKEIIEYAKLIHQKRRDETQMNLFLQEAYKKNIDYFSMNFSWARKRDSISIDARIDYYLTNESYKNRVYNYWVKTNNLNRRVTYHRALSLAMLGKMKMIRNGYNAEELTKLFKSINMKPFDILKCDDQDFDVKKDKQIRQSSTIANLQSNPINIVMKNRKGEKIRKILLDPMEFTAVTNSWQGPVADHFCYYELIDDDQCIQRYAQETYGFLLIE